MSYYDTCVVFALLQASIRRSQVTIVTLVLTTQLQCVSVVRNCPAYVVLLL